MNGEFFSTSTLEHCQSLPEHFLTFLKGVLVGHKLFLSLRQSLTEIGRFLQYDNFGCSIRRLQIRNQRSKKFKSVAQIDSSLTFHRIVLRSFFAAVLRIAGRPGTTFARGTRSALAGRTGSFTTAATTPFAILATTHLHLTRRFLARRRRRL